ncbi:DnaJ domain-containing protein [Xylaria bambusicola]|uniref:DnaJ domain-containing protein n=1 Tax=Xylaria bambusicola TaxID=326684 RepID=UPI002008B10D|nr:DnaJ domain-containing protein [Xylaria bambusicola]KAI0516769.1 DnaJ domain-containing protein [Xylaria bambusicola]
MSSVDLYEVLGVPSDADEPSIERAFKDLSLKLHPDKANVSTAPSVETEAERKVREQHNHEQFVKVMDARTILTDPVKRKSYDRERRLIKRSADKAEHSSSTRRQKVRTDNRETVKRLESLDLELRNLLSVYRELTPRRYQSLWLPTHSEIESLFIRVICIHVEVTNKVTKKPPSTYTPSTDKPVQREANVHISLIGALIAELDATLTQRKTYMASDTFYCALDASFKKFLDS